VTFFEHHRACVREELDCAIGKRAPLPRTPISNLRRCTSLARKIGKRTAGRVTRRLPQLRRQSDENTSSETGFSEHRRRTQLSSDDLDHHRVRVREELDCAYRATSTAAVHAHFKLAALHMNRVDELVRAAHREAKLALGLGAADIALSLSKERTGARC
jgi:hypothetical protein